MGGPGCPARTPGAPGRLARSHSRHFVMDDPFTGVAWPRKVDPEPDPFTAEERDLVLDFFWRRKRHYYPLVYTLFFTGLRTGEAVGLRWGAVNLRRSTLSVRVSRTLGEDNPPKTKKSTRPITLRPDVVAVLRSMHPIRAAAAGKWRD